MQSLFGNSVWTACLESCLEDRQTDRPTNRLLEAPSRSLKTKNGRFLLEAAIVEYLRPWEIISNYESNKSRVIKNQAI